MQITFKINTGTIKTGKHLQSRFNNDDKKNLEYLEDNSELLFNAFLTGKIKNKSGGFQDLRERVEFNVLKNKGINDISYSKSKKGFFTTYLFQVS